MMHRLTVWIDMLPPTQNHAYANKPLVKVRGKMVGGGRRLTEEGKNFKMEATDSIAKAIASLPDGGKSIVPNKPYLVSFTFVFLPLELFNKGYPKKTKNRYKRVDTLNRGKLLEDALADALGFDDSHNFKVDLEKRPGDAHATVIDIYEMEDEWTELGFE